jgi:hypothetical protein
MTSAEGREKKIVMGLHECLQFCHSPLRVVLPVGYDRLKGLYLSDGMAKGRLVGSSSLRGLDDYVYNDSHLC